MKLTFALKAMTLFFLLTLTNSLLSRRHKVPRKFESRNDLDAFKKREKITFPLYVEEMAEQILESKNIIIDKRIHFSDTVSVYKANVVKANSIDAEPKTGVIVKVDIPDKTKYFDKVISSEGDLMRAVGPVPFVINTCGYFKAKVGPAQTDVDIMILPQADIDVDKMMQALYRNGQSFSEKTQIKLMYQMILGLANLHQKGFVHNDIKANNYFMMKNKQVLLADLGESFRAGDKIEATLKRGLIKYFAPEITQYVEGETLEHLPSFKSDVYALGLLFARIFSIEFYNCSFSDKECIISSDLLATYTTAANPKFREQLKLFAETLKTKAEMSKGRLFLLDLIFNHMLEVDITNRISSEDLVKLFEEHFPQITQKIKQKYSGINICPIEFEDDFDLVANKQENTKPHTEEQTMHEKMDDLFADLD